MSWSINFVVKPRLPLGDADPSEWCIWTVRSVVDALSDADALAAYAAQVKVAHLATILANPELHEATIARLGAGALDGADFDRLWTVEFAGGFTHGLETTASRTPAPVVRRLNLDDPAVREFVEQTDVLLPTTRQLEAGRVVARHLATDEPGRPVYLVFPFAPDRLVEISSPFIPGEGDGSVVVEWTRSELDCEYFEFVVRHSSRGGRYWLGPIARRGEVWAEFAGDQATLTSVTFEERVRRTVVVAPTDAE